MCNTCDECKFYDIMDGICEKTGEPRKSCGCDPCDDYSLADDLRNEAIDAEA